MEEPHIQHSNLQPRALRTWQDLAIHVCQWSGQYGRDLIRQRAYDYDLANDDAVSPRVRRVACRCRWVSHTP
jgi:hypothetical protein